LEIEPSLSGVIWFASFVLDGPLNILLIEDDEETARYVARGLRKAGHWVEHATTGTEGLVFARTRFHDLAVIDRMLPESDGLNVVKALRAEGYEIPILLLTTMSGIRDRVDGLDAGGDDYLVKPFALSELIARIHSLSRRTQRVGAEVQTRLRVGELELDAMARTVSRNGRRIDLQPQEFRVLEYLARHAGRVVTRTMLLENVWQLHFDPKTNIVESHMSRIRSKLDRESDAPLIQTVRGEGYILRAD
jgi:two-component system OmpR family response regulator